MKISRAIFSKARSRTFTRRNHAHVEIELKGGGIVTSSITNEAVAELGLKQGTHAYAVIKSSDVMIAVK